MATWLVARGNKQEADAMIERKEYLQRLYDWKDEQVIKVVTGIRRCGKSHSAKAISGKAYAEWYFTGTDYFHQF